jgi:cytochrome c-type biogenesis protein CcmH
MTTFVLLAAVLVIAGIALIAVPLLKKKPTEYSPAPWAALIAAGVIAIGSTVMYVRMTNWSWQTKASEDTPQTMVARLARKLEQNPDNLDGWLLLGRSYTQLQEFQLATRAFQRADRLSGGKSAEALIGEAEALARNDENELDGRAGKLIEQALAVDPNSGKALFFGAAVAMRKGELPLARERFTKLLALDPPDNIKPLLQKQIEQIDQQMAGGGPTQAGAAPAKAADSGAKVRINVSLAPTLAQSTAGSAPLFVFVRDPDRPGPPLAVKRLESRFPQTVALTA